ncbi:AAA family ATPase [Pseudovibrio sp. FO-BEG1]|uniref:AAA family ATPase n=1 Tax=Pseudovibrio sp. (strain FO-BEG1) TaxID=911045 RepID=UPI0002EB485B|nr:AAA family ATPase [Pseudovibrio sp. FO-BEG1]
MKDNDKQNLSARLPDKLPKTGYQIVWFGKEEIVGSEHDIVEGVLRAGELSVIYGESGVGKTFFALDVVLRIAAELDWFGRETKQCGVFYIAAEGYPAIQNRIAAWRLSHPDLEDLPFGLIPKRLDMRENMGRISELAIDIREMAAERGISKVVVVLDTLSGMLNGGVDSQPVDMAAFLQAASIFTQGFGFHVMVVHHSGKDKSKGMRGVTSLKAAADTVILVEKNGDRLQAQLEKQKDGPISEAIPFCIKPISIDVDAGLSSCIVDVAPNTLDKTDRTSGLSRVQSVVRNALLTELANTGEETIPLDVWFNAANTSDLSKSDQRTARRNAFNRAVEALSHKELVVVRDGRAWSRP